MLERARALPGDYNIEVYGTGTGMYTITIETVAADGSVIDTETWTGSTSTGELDRICVQVFGDGSLTLILPPPPVGGFWTSINKLELLTPYIGLVSLITVATVSIVYARYRKKKQT